MAELVIPSVAYRDSYLDALKEGFVHGGQKTMDKKLITWITENFEEHLKILMHGNPKKEIKFPDGNKYPRVENRIYWLVENNIFIGQSSFRPQLNEFLKKWGGNIGYGVRPLYKRQGMGKKLLNLTLEYVKLAGLSKVLITCDDDNIGSIKIIEASGGVLEKTVKYEWAEKPLRLYWLSVL